MRPGPRWMPLLGALGLLVAILLCWRVIKPPEPPEPPDPPRPPDPSTQAYVRTQLAIVRGVDMVLPRDLPAGYDHPLAYYYGTAQIGDDPTTASAHDRADSRFVVFYPSRNRTQADLPSVVMCVQLTDLKDELCPTRSDARHLQRHYRNSRVTIYVTGKAASWDVGAWKKVQLTSDLNQVRWLH